MKRLAWVGVVVGLWALSVQASAQDVPLACSGRIPSLYFNAGFSGGKSLARQAWRSTAVDEQCVNIDLFGDAVLSSLQRFVPTSSSNLNLTCRFAGLAAGAEAEVAGLFNGCADACFLEGQLVGEIAGMLYCELSILLGGLGLDEFVVRGPVQTCGFIFELACEANFETTALSFQNPFGRCRDYVRAPFVDVFEQARFNQCTFDPLPPDEDP